MRQLNHAYGGGYHLETGILTVTSMSSAPAAVDGGGFLFILGDADDH